MPETEDQGGFWSPPPEHVRYGVQQIIEHPYFLLADDMGGMKTAQAIISAQFMHDMNLIDRVIVVAPASVRPKVWFDRDIGQLSEQVFADKNNYVSEFHQRLKRWQHGPTDKPELRWIITNYEYIRDEANLAILLRYCTARTFLILDESSAVRGPDSAQTEACMKLRWLTNKKGIPQMGYPRCGRILELNGTPNAESPMDMFSQGNLLHPDILECKYKSQFKARYAIQEPVLKQGKPMVLYGKPVMKVVAGEAGWTNLDDLQRRFAPYILRRESKQFGVDFALPPVPLEVRLTDTTWKHYASMRDQMVVWLESGVVHAKQAGVKSLRLSQITSGFLGGLEDAGIGDDDFDSDDLDLFSAGDCTSEDGIPPWIAERRPVEYDERGIGCIQDSTKRNTVEYDALDLDAHLNVPGDHPRRRSNPVVEIGREKLDFALTWHAEKLRQYPNLKLLSWCRFVPELRRYLTEVQALTPLVGAACGSSVLGLGKKAEREAALRLLHPKTAPAGALTVGATQGTGAMGLNFTACRTVLDISFDFSSWKKKQGDARVNRTGQTGPVSFFYLIAVGPRGQKTVDHHVFAHRTGKMNVNDLTTAGWVKMLKEE